MLRRPSAKPEDVDLQEVMELSLSFKNIYSIDNLTGFEHLVKLQLDNNIIERTLHSFLRKLHLFTARLRVCTFVPLCRDSKSGLFGEPAVA